MDQMNISITDHLAGYVRAKVASGRYNNASGVSHADDRLCLVKGHDFSRADKANQINRALAPEGRPDTLFSAFAKRRKQMQSVRHYTRPFAIRAIIEA